MSKATESAGKGCIRSEGRGSYIYSSSLSSSVSINSLLFRVGGSFFSTRALAAVVYFRFFFTGCLDSSSSSSLLSSSLTLGSVPCLCLTSPSFSLLPAHQQLPSSQASLHKQLAAPVTGQSTYNPQPSALDVAFVCPRRYQYRTGLQT
jgi:hypothetical protein